MANLVATIGDDFGPRVITGGSNVGTLFFDDWFEVAYGRDASSD